MTDEAEILRAILLDPFDDRPRLIYADFLDETGEGRRAAFIRSQIANQNENGHCRVENGPGRIVALADTKIWDIDLKRLSVPSAIARANSGESEVIWRRGFVHSIATTGNLFIAKCGEIFSRHPVASVIIRRVLVHSSPSGWLIASSGSGWVLVKAAGVRSGYFQSFASACIHLNDTLVNHGRKLAGLPPLKEKS
jgi:uncharacterized protein (TIGR02996 family)